MIWLAAVIRVAIAPVLLGALVLLVNSARSPSDLAVSAGLVLLGAIHGLYWWRPGKGVLAQRVLTRQELACDAFANAMPRRAVDLELVSSSASAMPGPGWSWRKLEGSVAPCSQGPGR
jgi:hypothetical protein